MEEKGCESALFRLDTCRSGNGSGWHSRPIADDRAVRWERQWQLAVRAQGWLDDGRSSG